MIVAAWFTYNGAPFSGFARQNDQLTVQGSIEEALELLFRRPIETTCAGRTDAGVHALCQVVSFDLLPDEWFRRKPESLLKSLNALTHDDISFTSVRPMPEDFSARFSAVSREYRYYLCTDVAAPLLMKNFSWHLAKPLDIPAMERAASYLLGEHDFKSFCMAASAKDKPTSRYVADIRFKKKQVWKSNFVVMTVIGNAFLHSMVRTMVGTLALVGLGKRGPEWVAQVLAARDRQAAGQNAPAEGLVLWNVKYPEQDYYYDPRPAQLLGELAPEHKLSDAIEDIPTTPLSETTPGTTDAFDQVSYDQVSYAEGADQVLLSADSVHEDRSFRSSAVNSASTESAVAESKAAKKKRKAADSRWAQRKQDKEWAKGFAIPRGPNLDVAATGEIPVVSESATPASSPEELFVSTNTQPKGMQQNTQQRSAQLKDMSQDTMSLSEDMSQRDPRLYVLKETLPSPHISPSSLTSKPTEEKERKPADETDDLTSPLPIPDSASNANLDAFSDTNLGGASKATPKTSPNATVLSAAGARARRREREKAQPQT